MSQGLQRRSRTPRLLDDSEVRKYNPNGRVVAMKLEMERYDSVLEFSSQVKKDLPALHVLLLNAGVDAWTYTISPTAHDSVLQVNYLSNALLALELLPTARIDRQINRLPNKPELGRIPNPCIQPAHQTSHTVLLIDPRTLRQPFQL